MPNLDFIRRSNLHPNNIHKFFSVNPQFAYQDNRKKREYFPIVSLNRFGIIILGATHIAFRALKKKKPPTNFEKEKAEILYCEQRGYQELDRQFTFKCPCRPFSRVTNLIQFDSKPPHE